MLWNSCTPLTFFINWTYCELLPFPISVTSFVFLHLHIFVLFHLKQMKFSQPTHLILHIFWCNIIFQIKFLKSQKILLRLLTLLLGSQMLIVTVRALSGFYFLLSLLFVLKWPTLPKEILILVKCPFFLTFCQNWKRMSLTVYNYSCSDSDGIFDHLRDVLWVHIFEFVPSANATEFCECVHVRIDVYKLHQKLQVRLYTSS